MLQRIQTLYLLVATILMCLLLFLPYGEIIVNNTGIYKIGALGVEVPVGDTLVIYQTYPVFVISLLSSLLTLLTIFMFKKRILQIRLCVANFVLMLASCGLMFFYIHRAAAHFNAEVYHGLLMVLPMVAAILLWLAIRAIGKDEALVRSVDRIR